MYFDILKNVIESKDFELNDMLLKIDTIWIQGGISDEQKDELKGLARDNADPTKTITLYKTLENLDARVRKLEEGKETTTPTVGEYKQKQTNILESRWLLWKSN